jgi:hypothetical protein
MEFSVRDYFEKVSAAGSAEEGAEDQKKLFNQIFGLEKRDKKGDLIYPGMTCP